MLLNLYINRFLGTKVKCNKKYISLASKSFNFLLSTICTVQSTVSTVYHLPCLHLFCLQSFLSSVYCLSFLLTALSTICQIQHLLTVCSPSVLSAIIHASHHHCLSSVLSTICTVYHRSCLLSMKYTICPAYSLSCLQSALSTLSCLPSVMSTVCKSYILSSLPSNLLTFLYTVGPVYRLSCLPSVQFTICPVYHLHCLLSVQNRMQKFDFSKKLPLLPEFSWGK